MVTIAEIFWFCRAQKIRYLKTGTVKLSLTWFESLTFNCFEEITIIKLRKHPFSIVLCGHITIALIWASLAFSYSYCLCIIVFNIHICTYILSFMYSVMRRQKFNYPPPFSFSFVSATSLSSYIVFVPILRRRACKKYLAILFQPILFCITNKTSKRINFYFEWNVVVFFTNH